MAIKRTNISYADFSGGDLNFVIRGVRKGDCECSPECEHCYAGALLRRMGCKRQDTQTYPDKLERLARATFDEKGVPFRRGSGSRPIAFVCDMGDLFHESVPASFIVRALDVMRDRTDVDWLILTKRAGRLASLSDRMMPFPEHMWIGATVGCRSSLPRVEYLRYVPARVRWLSLEPMLEPFDVYWKGISWVALGGESGKNRRPFDLDWARAIRDRCRPAGVKFYYKQGSDLRPGANDWLDGQQWHEFPEVGQ